MDRVLCFSHNYHCYAASLLSLYHFKFIYGGLTSLYCWVPYSDADCRVGWALSSCSLGKYLFLITILPLTYLYSSAPILIPLLAMVGLLALVIRLCIQARIGSVASVIGCFLFWVPSGRFEAFLAGLPFVVLLSRHSCAIWVIRGGQPGLCCTACLCLAALLITSH